MIGTCSSLGTQGPRGGFTSGEKQGEISPKLCTHLLIQTHYRLNLTPKEAHSDP